MILVLGIAAGWLCGLVRSRISRQPYRVPEFKMVWLVLAAVLPQLLIFQIPKTAAWFSSTWIPVILVASQLVLLVFIWFNRKWAGIKILGLGLILNLLVIILNGGLMPISPETVQALYPQTPLSTWQTWFLPGRSKNILLPVTDTLLPWLSDFILVPKWFPTTWALSPGDIIIVLGVFWLLAFESPDQSSLIERSAQDLDPTQRAN